LDAAFHKAYLDALKAANGGQAGPVAEFIQSL